MTFTGPQQARPKSWGFSFWGFGVSLCISEATEKNEIHRERMILSRSSGEVRTRAGGLPQELRFAERLLWEDPGAAAEVAEAVAQREERCAAAYALAALARYESGQVDRRMLSLLDDAERLIDVAPDQDAERLADRLSEMLERSRDADRAGSRAATWLAAGAGTVRRTGEPREETAWLTFLAERDCSAALLDAGGGPELPNVHRVARVAWYSVLAATETAATTAAGWARRARAAAATLAADTGRPLRAGYAYLAWTYALIASAPDEAAGWAVMAADAFEMAGDSLNAGWAHLNAAFALAAGGRVGSAVAEQKQARALLDSLSPALYPLLCGRAGPAPAPKPALGQPGPTRRQRAVLELLANGLTAAAIARKLGISPRTVNHHLEHLYRKLGTSDRLATVLRAKALGLL